MRVELRIERIVIEGVEFSGPDRLRLKAALQTELAREFVHGGLAPSFLGGGAVPRLTGRAPVSARPGGDPRSLARGIAAGVRGVLSR